MISFRPNCCDRYLTEKLRYLETEGDGAVIRPWVWILALFLAPFVGAIALQWYVFLSVSQRLIQVNHKCELSFSFTIRRV